MSGGGGKSKLPTVSIGTGGLYGSGTAGANNSFNPTDFQETLVKTTESAIPEYLNQLINPTYDSASFQNQQSLLNKAARQGFENNVISPLASRGLTRGSSVNQLSGTFANNLNDLQQKAMANEDARVASVLNNLLGIYQTPYNIMQGLYGNANGLVNAQAQINAANNQARSGLFGGLAGGLGSVIGGLGSAYGGSQIAAALSAAAPAAVVASDRRLKENIRFKDKVNDINIYGFDYIAGLKDQIGVIAQEIIDIIPQAVGTDANGFYFVNYGMLPEEVQKRIEELRSEEARKDGK